MDENLKHLRKEQTGGREPRVKSCSQNTLKETVQGDGRRGVIDAAEKGNHGLTSKKGLEMPLLGVTLADSLWHNRVLCHLVGPSPGPASLQALIPLLEMSTSHHCPGLLYG